MKWTSDCRRQSPSSSRSPWATSFIVGILNPHYNPPATVHALMLGPQVAKAFASIAAIRQELELLLDHQGVTP